MALDKHTGDTLSANASAYHEAVSGLPLPGWGEGRRARSQTAPGIAQDARLWRDVQDVSQMLEGVKPEGLTARNLAETSPGFLEVKESWSCSALADTTVRWRTLNKPRVLAISFLGWTGPSIVSFCPMYP